MEGGVEPLQDDKPERREHPRQSVDATADLVLLLHDATVRCRVVDLSLTGCRLEVLEEFLPAVQSRIEVSFKVRGIALRFYGVAQWTDDWRRVGIRFVDATMRRREELTAVLAEFAAENAAKAERLAAEAKAEEERAEELAKAALSGEACPDAASTRPPQGPQLVRPAVPPGAHAAAGRMERRKQPRQAVDTSAEIQVVHGGLTLPGRILDISPGGCHIRTNQPFPMGIFLRVETVFRLHGLPFRLGGVTQVVHDRYHVGIRFLEMSDRKRETLDELIAEIKESRVGEQQAAAPKGVGEPPSA